MFLLNILITLFGLWHIFSKKRIIAILLPFLFIGVLAIYAYSIVYSTMNIQSKVIHLTTSLLGLGILGFILQAFKENKWAQVSSIICALVGLNLYFENPHLPVSKEISNDKSAELLVKVKENQFNGFEKEVKKQSFVLKVNPIHVPLRAEITELDDIYKIDITNGYSIDKAIDKISKIEGVDWIEPNEVLQLDLQSAETQKKTTPLVQLVDDKLVDQQWNLDVLNMQEYYPLFNQDKYKPLKTTKLFILDSGVDITHEDISGNFVSHASTNRSSNESDGNGHGTHCAGVAGAQTNNGLGIASMNPGKEWVTVSSVRVMNNFGIGTQAAIVEGIIEAVDQGADVISLSLGGRSTQLKEEAYDEAIAYAKKHNVILVAAAGNNASDASSIVPAKLDGVITVSAVDRNLNKAQFSNYVSNIKYGLAAPGTSILSSWKDKRYAAFDGTSMATPHVSGLISVMRALNPNLTQEEAYTILNDTGINTNETYKTGKLIQPANAIKALVK